MKTLDLSMLGEETPTQDCYSRSEREAHIRIREHVLSEVSKSSFDTFTLLIGNYDFAFEISATHEHSFYLKVRCGELMASYPFALPECAVESAMAAYRLLVSLPRSLHQGDEPSLILVDANGQTIREPEPENNHMGLQTLQLRPLVLDGRYIRGKVIPVADGSFIVLVIHHFAILRVLVDHQLFDYDQAVHFANFYMDNCDTKVPPEILELVFQRAVNHITN